VAGKATAFAGFPHQLQAAVLGARPGDLAGLRTVHVGGDRVRADLLETLARVASATTCTIVYGSTEIEPIAAIEAGTYLQHLAGSDPLEGTCVGPIVDGLELRLEPLSGGPASSLDRPQVGRILLCGPRASGSGAAGEWVDTGDVGRVDADGRLWLLGRAANRVDGMFPASVERVIEALPWVDQAVLVRGTGEHAAALLAVQPTRWDGGTAQAERVAQLAAVSQERGWRVADVLLVRQLPRSGGPAAKVDDGRLRALASSRRRRIASEHPAPNREHLAR
jgi:acyl-coenzyme A synthetase/AMP-(fatty) acid ligase